MSELRGWPSFPDALPDFAAARQRERPDSVPTGWTRFRIVARSVEFWQARHDRRHIRLRYRSHRGGWERERLWP